MMFRRVFCILALVLVVSEAFLSSPGPWVPTGPARAARAGARDLQLLAAEPKFYSIPSANITNDGPPMPPRQERDEITLARQRTELEALSKRWKQQRLVREYEDGKLLGFVRNAEIINGRSAMFFVFVGLITEAISGQSIPEQVTTMLTTFGVLGLD
mmetsp:Transcript_18092/g.52853  ORF Transcript_18092/g.52853 Transcript_18092/m.52853 type:complete len:157 (-) Transcript_18092:77-547(-)|eukprot:CAMPEP_0118961840 /NCGR_PEP_ID=MMETSP1173-20130426/395_1 /TAXON_ID=1034831 /ORGANISM="Rhizochromulina marina cf, Strain CCMP1243" /LENGTH=156 /DNA_ID=CAMNT_0006910035 /DNA_START=21 /DNA_END=491 /DNA_ORIENTATION=+